MAKQRNMLFALLFGVALFVTVAFIAGYFALVLFMERDVSFGDSVAVVDIFGEIYYNLDKVQEIERYRNDDDVKAVLIHINSPGGGVSGSQALYHAVRRVREVKPVVAVMGSVAASGGYYVACAADSIVALEGTITGSIGVIATFLRTEELFQKLGLDVTVIKTGKYKDVGSPHRAMTDDEREYMGDLLEDAYRQFLAAVSDGRGMPVERVRSIAEGRLYSGQQAFGLGLVDRVGTYDDGLAMAARLGGLSDLRPRVVKQRKRRSLADRLFFGLFPRVPFASQERISLKYIIP